MDGVRKNELFRKGQLRVGANSCGMRAALRAPVVGDSARVRSCSMVKVRLGSPDLGLIDHSACSAVAALKRNDALQPLRERVVFVSLSFEKETILSSFRKEMVCKNIWCTS